MIVVLDEQRRPYFSVPDDFLDEEIEKAYKRLEGEKRRIQILENEKACRYIERGVLQNR